MSGRPRIVCFGIVVHDRIYELDNLPSGAGKSTANAYRESGGGIAGTAAVAVSALGGIGAFMGALGDDPAGDALRTEMEALGVDLSLAQICPGARTPSSCALVDAAGERCLIVDRGSVQPRPLPVADAGAILVDHRFPSEALAVIAAAPPHVPLVFDAEGGDPEALRAVAAAVDYPIFSQPGLARCTGEHDPERGLGAVARALSGEVSAVRRPESAPDKARARAIGVTLGDAGSLWHHAGRVFHVPAPRVTARDTTGCGDVFHGAFALAMAERRTLPDAIAFASAAAALKAQNGDGWRGMPTRQQVLDLSLAR